MLTEQEVKLISRNRLFDLEDFIEGRLNIEEGYLSREYEENLLEQGYLQRDVPIRLPSWCFPNGNGDERTRYSEIYDGGESEPQSLVGSELWNQINLVKNGRLRYLKLHTQIGNQIRVCQDIYRRIFLRVVEHLQEEVAESRENKRKNYILFKIPVDKLGLQLPQTIAYLTIYLFPLNR